MYSPAKKIHCKGNEVMTTTACKKTTVKELRDLARKVQLKGRSKLKNKRQLCDALGIGEVSSASGKMTMAEIQRQLNVSIKKRESAKPTSTKKTTTTTVRGTRCSKQAARKYTQRKGPPYAANAEKCRGKRKKGNDGEWYVSKATRTGTYRWVKTKSAKTRRVPIPTDRRVARTTARTFKRTKSEHVKFVLRKALLKTYKYAGPKSLAGMDMNVLGKLADQHDLYPLYSKYKLSKAQVDDLLTWRQEESKLPDVKVAAAELVGLRHGDVLVSPAQYRGSGVWVVVETATGRKSAHTLKMDDAAYGKIPLTVTKHIEDPLRFYGGAKFEFPYGVDYIYLSHTIHRDALKTYPDVPKTGTLVYTSSMGFDN